MAGKGNCTGGQASEKVHPTSAGEKSWIFVGANDRGDGKEAVKNPAERMDRGAIDKFDGRGAKRADNTKSRNADESLTVECRNGCATARREQSVTMRDGLERNMATEPG